MMKSLAIKPIFAFLLAGCLALSLQANPITPQQAQQNALAFMQGRGKSIAISSLRATQPDELQPYYVFNIGDNQGYVIASGDDSAYAVLGYSDEGHIDLNNLPCNLQAWLDDYAHQIQYLQEHGTNASRAPKKTTSHPDIFPLLTSQWNQDSPYNIYCPIDPTTGMRCYSGCVATAMAQVMYYHRHRSVNSVLFEIPSYTTKTRRIHVDSIPAGTVIDWDNMLDYYSSYYDYSTEAQKQAIANFMKICGTAIEMDYTSEGSSAYTKDAKTAMQFFFNYSGKAQFLERSAYVSYSGETSNYSNEEWDEIIYNELANSRPVLYTGHSKDSGHAFVCDGYDSGFYHFNWGWGGNLDGYFYLAAFDDEEGLLGYQSLQTAVINLEPRAPQPEADAGIHFTDPYMKFNCLMMGDKNDDGALTVEEAVAVTDFELPYYRSSITSFDEFKYFTGITALNEQTFYGCSGLKSITLPNTLTTIGDYAFYYCSDLTDIDIPSSVRFIGRLAFCYSGLTSVNVNCDVVSYGAFGICSQLTKVTFGESVKYIGDQAFSYCSGLTNVTLPNSLIMLGERAFSYCSRLTHITLPNSLIMLGESAFSYCSGLTNVTLTNTLFLIGDRTFYGCTGLTNITFPNTMASIGDRAFYGCNELSCVTCLSSTPPLMYSSSFSNYDATLRVPVESVEAYKSSRQWSQFSNIVGIDPSLGDVNLDGEVNIADINVIIGSVLKPGSDCLNDYMSDVNGDGEVNIADVNALIDKILHHQ